jgi:DNA-binding response OmpR family regulator
MGDNVPRRPLHITLMLLLKAAGRDAEAAYDASTSVALAESNPPGLVFLDLAMPRLDGIALVRQLRHVQGMEQAVLVCLTGYSGSEYEKKALAICSY